MEKQNKIESKIIYLHKKKDDNDPKVYKVPSDIFSYILEFCDDRIEQKQRILMKRIKPYRQYYNDLYSNKKHIRFSAKALVPSNIGTLSFHRNTEKNHSNDYENNIYYEEYADTLIWIYQTNTNKWIPLSQNFN